MAEEFRSRGLVGGEGGTKQAVCLTLDVPCKSDDVSMCVAIVIKKKKFN